LSVGGLNYTFYTEQNRIISLDADLLDLIDLGGDEKLEFEGKQALQVDDRRLVGYQLWQVHGLLGPGSLNMILADVTPDKVKELKK
jgi:hypothetical protein